MSQTIKTTTINTDIQLSGNDIIALLKSTGIDIEPDAKVYFTVPTGGDYSGMDIRVDSEDPIRVEFSRTTKSE